MNNKPKRSVFRTSFTYFIPSPPHRKSGYREREFDKIMQGILNSGFEIEELRTESVQTPQSGMFILTILKAKSKKVFTLDENIDIHESFKLSEEPLDNDIIYEEDE
ncbi:MAG TPA: hypothetical protein VKY27_00675 [Bacteriovoracaceae bacterium]|nr:hypothetical protein [Bacteriovoracaceae bacterium]